MRMRNPKNKEEILASCTYYLDETLFNNNNSIHMELGMGKGQFILNMAINHPDINFIGVEKYSSVACIAIKKINEYDLPNLKIFIGDAIDLPEYLNKKIETIYLNFSDPWPKERNKKRRLTHEVYLKKYDDLFKQKNIIILKTDNDSFFEFSENSLIDYGYDIIDKYFDLHNANVENVFTEYEEKFSKQGIKIKYLKVEKDNN